MSNNTQIQDWKKKYGKIYKLILEGKEVIYRKLNAGELSTIKDEEDLEKIPSYVILNGAELSLSGSILKLSQHVMDVSSLKTKEELKNKVTSLRQGLSSNFILCLIGKLCSIFPAYNPDMLRLKTMDELLELLVLAEMVTGIDIFNPDPRKKKMPSQMPSYQNSNKFKPFDPSPGMDAAAQALAEKIRQEGGKVNDFKPKKALSGLAAQMEELNKF